MNILYRENDWVYVIVAESRREGFIPHSYCAPCEHHDLKKKLPRSRSPACGPDLQHRDVSQWVLLSLLVQSKFAIVVKGLLICIHNYNFLYHIKYTDSASSLPLKVGIHTALMYLAFIYHLAHEYPTARHRLLPFHADTWGGYILNQTYINFNVPHRLSVSDGATNDGHSEIGSEGEACPFSKDPSGRYVVLYTFTARDENDVDVERGEFVTGKYLFYYLFITVACKKWRQLLKKLGYQFTIMWKSLNLILISGWLNDSIYSEVPTYNTVITVTVKLNIVKKPTAHNSMA